MIKKIHLALLGILVVGGIIIGLGFEVNSDTTTSFEEKSDLDKLRDYKSNFEEINQLNYEHLDKLEEQLKLDLENKTEIEREIQVLEKIIEQNNEEIEKITQQIEGQ